MTTKKQIDTLDQTDVKPLSEKEQATEEMNAIMRDNEKPIKSDNWITKSDELKILQDVGTGIEYTIDAKTVADIKRSIELREKYPDVELEKKPTLEHINVYIIHDDVDAIICSTSFSVLGGVKGMLYWHYKKEQTTRLHKYKEIVGLKVVLIGCVIGRVTETIKNEIFCDYVKRTKSKLKKSDAKTRTNRVPVPKPKTDSEKIDIILEEINKLKKKMSVIMKKIDIFDDDIIDEPKNTLLIKKNVVDKTKNIKSIINEPEKVDKNIIQHSIKQIIKKKAVANIKHKFW